MGTYVWQAEGDSLICSDDLLRLYGLEHMPRSSREIAALVHPEDRCRIDLETNGALRSDAKSYSRSFRIIRPDGSVRAILDRGAISRDAAGKATVIRGITIDVTGEAGFGEAPVTDGGLILRGVGAGDGFANGRDVGMAQTVHEAAPQGSRQDKTKAHRSGGQESAEMRLRASELRYRTLFDAIDEGFCVIEVRFDTPDGRIDYRVVEANPAFYKKTGFEETILGRWMREFAPDLEDHWYEIYGRVARAGESVRFEENSKALGRWFDVYAFQPDSAQSHRVAVLFNDVTTRKRHEQHTEMVMRELNHRSKNLLALVEAVARQTASSHAADFLPRFGERVRALASSHDLLFQHAWQAVPIEDLIRSQLAHFADLVGTRIGFSGPVLMITADAAQALGMAFHELATNAAKYGALANDTGSILIAWDVVGAGDQRHLTLRWSEQGGPDVAKPAKRGFGSKVTTEMVQASTGGNVTVEYENAGLTWRLSCDASAVLRAA
ncbi:MAG: HWE histidine kinase domain-containing protein [Rhodobacterales bacterium]